MKRSKGYTTKKRRGKNNKENVTEGKLIFKISLFISRIYSVVLYLMLLVWCTRGKSLENNFRNLFLLDAAFSNSWKLLKLKYDKIVGPLAVQYSLPIQYLIFQRRKSRRSSSRLHMVENFISFPPLAPYPRPNPRTPLNIYIKMKRPSLLGKRLLCSRSCLSREQPLIPKDKFPFMENILTGEDVNNRVNMYCGKFPAPY